MEHRLTQADFKIGQVLTCIKSPNISPGCTSTTDKDYLTVGKEYKIVDLDIHFPNSVCVEINKNYCAFVSIDYFVDKKSIIREKKINSILS